MARSDEIETDRRPPEDNPFIAFRRFADKQVAQLLNIVLASPTSPRARAQKLCLFGEADMTKCERLWKLESMSESALWLMSVQEQGNELYKEHRQQLDRYHSESARLAMEIIRDADRENFRDIRAVRRDEGPGQLVERVGNQKGQEVAGDWDWDFLQPADAAPTRNPPADLARDMPERMFERAFDELGNNFARIVAQMMQPCGSDLSPQYWPNALETDKHLSKAGVSWRDAFEDLMRVEVGAPLIPSHQLGESNRISYTQWLRRFWDPNFGRDSLSEGYPKKVPLQIEDSSDEPSYEYGHDHEDQHDDSPSPTSNGKSASNAPSTELDAYELLLGSASSSTESVAKPSVLSTLTTTERRYLPDGTMTETIVLKKRFSDGHEESSETVRTQRGQDIETRENQYTSHGTTDIQGNKANGTSETKGWFWNK